MKAHGAGLELCYQALERLVAGKPNNPEFRGQKITGALVSKEAGFDAGYLKKKRHPEIFEKIEVAQQNQSSLSGVTKAAIDKLEGQLVTQKKETERFKKISEEALARELRLLARVRELELKLNN